MIKYLLLQSWTAYLEGHQVAGKVHVHVTKLAKFTVLDYKSDDVLVYYADINVTKEQWCRSDDYVRDVTQQC